MIVKIQDKNNELKIIEVSKKGILFDDWYSIYDITTGRILKTKKAEEILKGLDIESARVVEVKEGRIMAQLAIDGLKLKCPFCDSENDFEKQDFCPHFFTLSEGPKAIFVIGEETKAINVWSGNCYIYLDVPTATDIEEKSNSVVLIYKSPFKFGQRTLMVYDYRSYRDMSKDVGLKRKTIGRVVIHYNAEKDFYASTIYPLSPSGNVIRNLFVVKSFTIDREIKNIAEEVEGNPIWKYKVIGRSTGREYLLYAVITDINHSFVVKTLNQTRPAYHIFSNDYFLLTEEEYKQQLHKKEGMLNAVKEYLTELRDVLKQKEKEELKKLIG